MGDKKFTLNIFALSEKYVLSIKFLYVMVCIFFDMTSNVLFFVFNLHFVKPIHQNIVKYLTALPVQAIYNPLKFIVTFKYALRKRFLNDFRVNNLRNLCLPFPLTHREKVTPYFCLCHFRCLLRLFQTLITFISPYPFTVCKFNHHFIYTTFFYF